MLKPPCILPSQKVAARRVLLQCVARLTISSCGPHAGGSLEGRGSQSARVRLFSQSRLKYATRHAGLCVMSSRLRANTMKRGDEMGTRDFRVG